MMRLEREILALLQ
uniref:Uncharacterized protein n=1 Tax=Anguilla anguilla TaxID=7936 RepID=A0A0E9U7S6_ANGAN